MTGILDHMRTMTPDTLEGVRSDFDDLPTPVYVSRRPKNMVRIVEGATDLRVDRPAPKNPGMVKAADWSPQVDEDYPSKAQVDDYIAHNNGDTCNGDTCNGDTCNGDTCNGPCCDAPAPVVKDGRSPRQVETMVGLLDQLEALDHELSLTARIYTEGMTEHGKWTPERGGNASVWIGNLIKKVRELKARPVTAPTTTGDADFQAIPNGYYAVGDAGPDDIHYFRISRFRDGGIKVQEQASDTLYPVRRGGRRTAILTTILHVGPAAASALYGQTIGRCGRCNRTLTDATSRARGIGPDCWDKM